MFYDRRRVSDTVVGLHYRAERGNSIWTMARLRRRISPHCIMLRCLDNMIKFVE